MSIIYSYPEQGALNANDMLIGTSAEKVGGKQKNITRNFTVQQIADFINQGTGFVDPVASDFQIPVFNQGGKKITGSIISQNTSPSNGSVGSAITIAGSLTTTGAISTVSNLTASGIVTLGSQANLISLNSNTRLNGPILDVAGNTGLANQILISNGTGNVYWQNYEAGLTYEGTWDASTNTPTLTSGQGVSGHFYIVSVAGNTNLDGNNDWHIGDWAVFFDAGGGGNAAWQKIDNTSVLTGNGTANTLAMWTATETLNDSLLSQDVGATKVIVDGLLEVKGDGASQDGRIKLNCSQNSHGVTIQSPPHSAGASYTLVLPTSVGTSGQALTTDGSDPAQLSWTTLTAPVTGTGTQNYVTKWSAGGAGIENSTIFDNGTNVGIGTTSPGAKLDVRSNDPSIMVAADNASGISSLILRGLGSNGTSNAYTEIKAIPEGSGTASSLSFDTRNSPGTISEKMRITSNGNVGIGTSSPGGKVHVYEGPSGQSSPNVSANTLVLEDNVSNGLSILTPDTSIGSIFFGDNNDNFVGGFRYDHSDDSLDINVNNATALSIDSTRNVGIGTSTPASLLSVRTAGISGDQDFATFSRGTSTEYEVLKISRSAGSANFLAEQNITLSADYNNNHTGANSNIVLKTDNAERMRIISSGNVGIGTTSPAVSLDISATDAVQMPVGITTDRPSTGVSNGMLRYNSTNNEFEGYINGNWGSIGGGASGGLIFRGTFNAATGAIAGGGNLTTGATRVAIAVGDMYIVDTAGDFYGDTSKPLNVGDEVICVLDAAVGTSDINDWNAIASGAGGAVTGSGTTNYIPKFTGATVVGNSSIFNDSSGNVGIGTTSPSTAKLVIETGPGSGIDLYRSAVNANFEAFRFRDSSNANTEASIGWGGDQLRLNSTNNTVFTTAGSERMRIDSSGDVGIGTSSPSAKLDVAGATDESIRLSTTYPSDRSARAGIRWYDATNETAGIWTEYEGSGGQMSINFGNLYNSGYQTNTSMIIRGNGNVGIGTNSPEVSLDLGNNTDAIRVPNGAQADRPSGILPGMIRYNTSSHEFEGYSGTVGVSGSWGALGGGAPTITKQLFTVTTAQSIFTLTAGVNPQDANYVNIFIDGVYQNSGTYTVATATGTTTVTLNTAAPVGTSVEIISTT